MNKVVVITDPWEMHDRILGIGSDYYSAVMFLIESEYLEAKTIEERLDKDAEEIFNLSINEFNDIFCCYHMEEISVYTYL